MNGFTLIELIIVIGLLSSVTALTAFSSTNIYQSALRRNDIDLFEVSIRSARNGALFAHCFLPCQKLGSAFQVEDHAYTVLQDVHAIEKRSIESNILLYPEQAITFYPYTALVDNPTTVGIYSATSTYAELGLNAQSAIRYEKK